MKKGCFGCLGCGCLLVILSIVIPGVMFWNWVDTDGRKFMAENIQKTVEEGSKLAFEPSSVVVKSLSMQEGMSLCERKPDIKRFSIPCFSSSFLR